jgi:hypothetical protein
MGRAGSVVPGAPIVAGDPGQGSRKVHGWRKGQQERSVTEISASSFTATTRRAGFHGHLLFPVVERAAWASDREELQQLPPGTCHEKETSWNGI